jgi:hypothetical protein
MYLYQSWHKVKSFSILIGPSYMLFSCSNLDTRLPARGSTRLISDILPYRPYSSLPFPLSSKANQRRTSTALHSISQPHISPISANQPTNSRQSPSQMHSTSVFTSRPCPQTTHLHDVLGAVPASQSGAPMALVSAPASAGCPPNST